MWKSRKMDGLVAVEDNEEPMLHCSIRGCLLCYVYGVHAVGEILQCERELDNVKDRYAIHGTIYVGRHLPLVSSLFL